MNTRTLWWSAVLGGAFAAILSACGGTVDSGNGGSTTTTTTTVQLTACEKYELAFTACCKTFSEPAKTACLDAAASMSWGTLDASACTAAYNAFSCPGTGTGGYAGGGAGYHFSWFALFARGRVQATLADGLPGTVYTALHGGMQFRIARRVDLHASGGIFNLHPGAFAPGVSPYWDLGLAVYFDVPRRRRPTARAPHLLSL